MKKAAGFDQAKFIARARRRPIWRDTSATRAVSIGSEQIAQVLPHRAPMLLVDEITALDLSQRAARARRVLDQDDPVFRGHFPDYPVYPGALLVEMMGQLAVCLHHFLCAGRHFVDQSDSPGGVRLLRLHHAVFLAEARPRDEITLLGQRLEADAFTMIAGAQALREDTILAAAVMEVYLVQD